MATVTGKPLVWRRWHLPAPVPFSAQAQAKLRAALRDLRETPQQWSKEELDRIRVEYQATKIDMIHSHPFYAWILMGMRTRWLDPAFPFAAATGFERGQLVMYIHPQKFLEESRVARIAILRHEVEHVVRLHLSRGEGLFAKHWNVAADAAINPSIEHIPEWAVFPQKLNMPEGLTAEEYYGQLMQRHDPSQCSDCMAGRQHGQDPRTENHGFWKKARGAQRRAFESQVRRLVRHAQRQAGNVPGHLQDAVTVLMNHNPISWNEVLRRFIARAIQEHRKTDWRKPHRRHGEDFPGSKRKPILNLAVAFDTSGSVSDKEAALFFSEIAAMQAMTKANIWVFEADAEVGKVYQFNGIPESITGRGGTDFRPFFEALAEPDRIASVRESGVFPRQWDAAIYLTDGYGPAPEVAPQWPTLWVLTPDGTEPATWGTSVRIAAS